MSDDFDIRLKAQLRALADAVPTATVAAGRPAVPGRLGHGRPMTRTALPIGSLAAVVVIVLSVLALAPRLGFNAAAPSSTPDSGHFTPTGSMTTGRAYATATVLQDGRVLIAGGVDGTAYLASAELYDPATGRFSVTGSMAEGRSGHTATLLRDGRVLILGGGASVWHDASAELYDPATGTFSSAGSMTASRSSFTATPLKDGRVLVSGGMGANGLPTTSAELYDPSTGEFSQTGSMAGARLGHSATLLADGRVLIAGGDVTTPESVTAELYDPSTGQFHVTGSMARLEFEPTLLKDDRVLLIGGSDEAGLSGAHAELYDAASGTFTETGSMTTGRDTARAVRLADGRVLVAGGAFQDLTPPRTNMVNELLSSAELFDPASGRFVPTGSMSTVRVGFMAVLLGDGRVLVAGGDVTPPGGGVTSPGQLSAPLASAELYEPSKPAAAPQPSATATATETAIASAVTVLSPKVVASFGSDNLTATVLGPDGAAYVLDGTTKTVYRVDLQTWAKLPVVVAGQGAQGTAVGTPRLLAVDGSDVLVLDNSNSLWRWRPALGDRTGRGVLGMVSVPDSVNWGTGVRAIGTFLAVAAFGEANVYVVCPARQNILKYVPAVDGSGYPTAGRVNYLGVPQDVSTVDDMYVDGAIYLVDGGRITRYESGRAVTGWAPGLPPNTKPEPVFFARLAADNNDNANPDQGTFYAYDSAGHRIVAFSKKDGAYVGQYAAPGDTSLFTHLNGMFVVRGTGTTPATLYWVESGNLMGAALDGSASPAPAVPTPSAAPVTAPPGTAPISSPTAASSRQPSRT